MRAPVLALVIAAAWSPALAQAWSYRAYTELGVSTEWPSDPMVSRTDPLPGQPAQVVFSLDRGSSRFSLTVSDFSHGGDPGKAAREALQAARASGQVKLDLDECISGQPGRELSVWGADGGRSKVSVFQVGRRLYVLEARLAPADVDDASGDADRFQQSLSFSRGPLGAGPDPQPACRGRAREASAVG